MCSNLTHEQCHWCFAPAPGWAPCRCRRPWRLLAAVRLRVPLGLAAAAALWTSLAGASSATRLLGLLGAAPAALLCRAGAGAWRAHELLLLSSAVGVHCVGLLQGLLQGAASWIRFRKIRRCVVGSVC